VAFKTFTDGVALPASDLNTYLMKQAVIVCTSGTRPSSPIEGMVIFETDTDRVYAYSGTAWIYLCGGTQPLYSCRAYRSTALDIAAGVSTTLILCNTESWDYNSNFDTATGRYTVPVTGLYHVNGEICYNGNNNPDEVQVGIYVNATIRTAGGRLVTRSGTGTDDWALTVSDIVAVSATDVIDLRADHLQGGNVNALNVDSAHNYISICKI